MASKGSSAVLDSIETAETRHALQLISANTNSRFINTQNCNTHRHCGVSMRLYLEIGVLETLTKIQLPRSTFWFM